MGQGSAPPSLLWRPGAPVAECRQTRFLELLKPGRGLGSGDSVSDSGTLGRDGRGNQEEFSKPWKLTKLRRHLTRVFEHGLCPCLPWTPSAWQCYFKGSGGPNWSSSLTETCFPPTLYAFRRQPINRLQVTTLTQD